ncbi:hypothetical protein [Roseibium sediminicola]|uniref:hypothetical protein n=1 Tax=Roseibium sediminicola TaxID=2933272 RepID=UPI002006A51A|nr:hypothetical protein [Roseibium sp. CAU 1639]
MGNIQEFLQKKFPSPNERTDQTDSNSAAGQHAFSPPPKVHNPNRETIGCKDGKNEPTVMFRRSLGRDGGGTRLKMAQRTAFSLR